MVSKWMKNKEELFKQFKDEKNREVTTNTRSGLVWTTPEKGTEENPKIYQLRFLMDPNDNFYKSYHYHMYYAKSEEKWQFVLCPKTFDFSAFCPFCAAVSKLYLGSSDDKRVAYNFKRKPKHCCNVFVVNDPRDADKIEEEKSTGKVLIYEFPTVVEKKIKAEQSDTKYGAGFNLYDPGKDGFDFILKVGSTKPMQDEGPNRGKVFPNYDNSKFSSKPSAILDSDSAIEQVMESRHDLDKYLKNMIKSDDEMVKLLKREMLWDLIANEATVRMKLDKKELVDQDDSTDKDDSLTNTDSVKEEVIEDDSNVSDEALLRELDSL